MNGSSKIFHQLTKNGDLVALKKMIEDGFEDINGLDENGKAPIVVAIFHKHYKIVEYLLEIGANVNVQAINGFTPLHAAVDIGHQDIIMSCII